MARAEKKIIFSPFASELVEGVSTPIPSRDMASPFFYKKKCFYFLTNGANLEINNAGGGTTEAIQKIVKASGKDFFDKSKMKKVDNDGDLVNVGTFENFTPYYVADVHESDNFDNVVGVFHVIGKKFAESDLKSEREKNIPSVIDYYSRIIKAVNKIASDLSKHYILYLARIPGKLFNGGVETVFGMIQAISNVEQSENVTYQIDVSSELYYLAYEHLYNSRVPAYNGKNLKLCHVQETVSETTPTVSIEIKEAFKRLETSKMFVCLYMLVGKFNKDNFKELSVIMLTIKGSLVHDVDLKLDLLNDGIIQPDAVDGGVVEADAAIVNGKIVFSGTGEKKYDILILNFDDIYILFTKNENIMNTDLFCKYSLDLLVFNLRHLKNARQLLTSMLTKNCQYERSELGWVSRMKNLLPKTHFTISYFFKKNYPTEYIANSIEDVLGNTQFLVSRNFNCVIFYKNKKTVYLTNLTNVFLYFVKFDNVTFKIDDIEDDYLEIIKYIDSSHLPCIFEIPYEDEDLEENGGDIHESKHEDKSEKLHNTGGVMSTETLVAIVTSPDYGKMIPIDRNMTKTGRTKHFRIGENEKLRKTDCEIDPSHCVSLYQCILCGNKFPSWDEQKIYGNDELDKEYKQSYGCECPTKLYVQHLYRCKENQKLTPQISCFNSLDKNGLYLGPKLKLLKLDNCETVGDFETYVVYVPDYVPAENYTELDEKLTPTILRLIKLEKPFQIIFIGTDTSPQSKEKIQIAIKLTNRHPSLNSNISMTACTVEDVNQRSNNPAKGRKWSMDKASYRILRQIVFFLNESKKNQLFKPKRSLKKSKPKRSLKKSKSKKQKL